MTKEEQEALNVVQPLCCNCKHYEDNDGWSTPTCKRAVMAACNVTGQITLRECHDERNRGIQGSCGKQGVFFEYWAPIKGPVERFITWLVS